MLGARERLGVLRCDWRDSAVSINVEIWNKFFEMNNPLWIRSGARERENIRQHMIMIKRGKQELNLSVARIELWEIQSQHRWVKWKIILADMVSKHDIIPTRLLNSVRFSRVNGYRAREQREKCYGEGEKQIKRATIKSFEMKSELINDAWKRLFEA